MKKSASLPVFFLAVVLSLLPLQALSQNQSAPIKIGAILILSGLGAEQGMNSEKGARLAQEEINQAGGVRGRKLEIIFEDEVGPNPRGAVSAFHKLTTLDGVKYILGPQWLNEVQAVDPLAVKGGVFLVIPSTCGPGLSDHTFCVWADPEQEVDVYAKYIFARHKTIVAFGSSEPWETICLKRFAESYTKLGGQVIQVLAPNENQTDVKTEATRTMAARPEAIFSSGAIHFVSYRKDLVRLRVGAPFYMVELFQELINAAGPAAEGVFYITPTLPDENFKAKFRTRFNVEPDIPATQAYDAIHMLAAAIEKNGEGFDKVQHYFRNFGEYHGAIGTIRSLQGKAAVPKAIYQVRNAKSVLVAGPEEVSKLE